MFCLSPRSMCVSALVCISVIRLCSLHDLLSCIFVSARVCVCVRVHVSVLTSVFLQPAVLHVTLASEFADTNLGLAKPIYSRCIHGVFGREITIHTVIYGVCMQLWPTLHLTTSCEAANLIPLVRLCSGYTDLSICCSRITGHGQQH